MFSQSPESGSRARIAVLPPDNTIGGSQYEVISETIRETVTLTLKLLGTFRVIESGNIPKGQTISEIRLVAEQNRLDNVIFGEIREDDSGSVMFILSVYSSSQNRIIDTKTERVESLIETFDAADRLVISLLESFSRSHIGWGTIALQNTGVQGSYTVFVDGEIWGENLRSLSNVLIGLRHVTVKQERPFQDAVLADTKVEVLENKSVNVRFTIPALTKNELNGFRVIEETLLNAWNNGKTAEVDEQFELAFSLLEKAKASEELEKLRSKYKQWEDAFKRGERIAELDERSGIGGISAANIEDAEELVAYINNMERRVVEIETRLQYETNLWELDNRFEDEKGLLTLLRDISQFKDELDNSFIDFPDLQERVAELQGKVQSAVNDREKMLVSLEKEQTLLEKQHEDALVAEKNRRTAAWITLGTGIGLGGVSTALWFVGNNVYDKYLNAASVEEAKQCKTQFIIADTLTYGFAGLSGAGFTISIVLFLGGSDPNEYQREIERVKREIVFIEGEL